MHGVTQKLANPSNFKDRYNFENVLQKFSHTQMESQKKPEKDGTKIEALMVVFR